MKSTVPVEWACTFLGERKYKALQAHYHENVIFRFVLISVALVTQVIGLVFVCVLGILIGSFLLGFLR